MISLKNSHQGFKGEGGIHIMSSRRVSTWRLVQTVLLVIIAILVALDLSSRMACDQMRKMISRTILETRQDNVQQMQQIQGESPLPSSMGHTQENEINIMEESGHNNRYGMEKAGSKLRTMMKADLPPEMSPDWDPSVPETPVSRFPKALLFGFGKCGTSALLEFLNIHPNIVSLDWEIDYFCDRVYYKYSPHWYRMRMPLSTSKQVTLEKSPCYAEQAAAMDRIKAFNSSMKVMVIVRDPFTRILSQHSQYLASARNFGKEPESLWDRYFDDEDKIRESPLMKTGVYNDKMEMIYSKFEKKQVHVIDGDMFIKNPLPVLKQIERFLGVPSWFSEQDVFMDPEKGFHCPRNRLTKEVLCLSDNKGRSHVAPSPEFRKRILEYIQPHTSRFFQLTGQRFDWTRR